MKAAHYEKENLKNNIYFSARLSHSVPFWIRNELTLTKVFLRLEHSARRRRGRSEAKRLRLHRHSSGGAVIIELINQSAVWVGERSIAPSAACSTNGFSMFNEELIPLMISADDNQKIDVSVLDEDAPGESQIYGRGLWTPPFPPLMENTARKVDKTGHTLTSQARWRLSGAAGWVASGGAAEHGAPEAGRRLFEDLL